MKIKKHFCTGGIIICVAKSELKKERKEVWAGGSRADPFASVSRTSRIGNIPNREHPDKGTPRQGNNQTGEHPDCAISCCTVSPPHLRTEPCPPSPSLHLHPVQLKAEPGAHLPRGSVRTEQEKRDKFRPHPSRV